MQASFSFRTSEDTTGAWSVVAGAERGARRDRGLGRKADRSIVLRRPRADGPEDGKANATLVRMIGDALQLPASAIAIEAGATSRIKTLFITVNGAEIARRLAGLAGVTT